MFSILYLFLKQKLKLKNRIVEVHLQVLINFVGQNVFYYKKKLIIIALL